MKKAFVAIALALSISSVYGQGIDFGDDSGNYPNDGECDDPRFEGPGAYSSPLAEDEFRDASDCLALFDSGQVWLIGFGPELFGALAVWGGTDEYGYGGTAGFATQAEADEGALSQCRAFNSNCEIVARFNGSTCVAVTFDESVGAIGWATGPDSLETANDAIDQCVGAGGNSCAVGDSTCNVELASSIAGSSRPSASGQSSTPARQPGETFSDELSGGGFGPEMVVIPAGSFQMGCVSGLDCRDEEFPVHAVTIPQALAVSKYEVTFEDWDRCAAGGGCGGYLPDDRGRGRRPVINVSWNDAQEYVAWLSRQTGGTYRLLSEAEWELHGCANQWRSVAGR